MLLEINMKVYEILAENKITDIINSVLKGVAWTLGNSVKNKAAKELAEAWSAKMIEAGNIRVSMPINVIKDPVLAADREVMNAAYKEAVKAFRQAERAGLIRDIKAGAAAVKEAVKDKAKKFFSALDFMAKYGSMAAVAWSLKDIWDDYVATEQNIRKNLVKTLEDSTVSDADKEKALADANQAIGSARMIYSSKVIAAIALGGTVKLVGGATGLVAKQVDKFKNWLGRLAGLKGNAAAQRLVQMLSRVGDVALAAIIYEMSRNQRFHKLLDDLVWNSSILQTINVNVIQPDAPFDSWEEVEALINTYRDLETAVTSGSLVTGSDKRSAPQAQPSTPAQSTAPASDTPVDSGVDWSKVKR